MVCAARVMPPPPSPAMVDDEDSILVLLILLSVSLARRGDNEWTLSSSCPRADIMLLFLTWDVTWEMGSLSFSSNYC